MCAGAGGRRRVPESSGGFPRVWKVRKVLAQGQVQVAGAGSGGVRKVREGFGRFRKFGRVLDGNAKHRFWKVPEGFGAVLSAAGFGRIWEVRLHFCPDLILRKPMHMTLQHMYVPAVGDATETFFSK